MVNHATSYGAALGSRVTNGPSLQVAGELYMNAIAAEVLAIADVTKGPIVIATGDQFFYACRCVIPSAIVQARVEHSDVERTSNWGGIRLRQIVMNMLLRVALTVNCYIQALWLFGVSFLMAEPFHVIRPFTD